MKNDKGISLIVLIIMIVVIIILSIITMRTSGDTVDESIEAKEKAQIVLDNEKIEEIITYELAENMELIDVEIDLKRIKLNDSLKLEYSGETYGEGYTLYLSEKDIEKVEKVTGSGDFFKSYKGITKSYVVNHESCEYIRLLEEWKIVK